ncbi:hypothetical protein B0O99DRAFT_651430 [Bisporella sp. PMI_857]|nr:hypothetical protein B0O99DRAFT_651430 [Bisporella sp. PMI_857]
MRSDLFTVALLLFSSTPGLAAPQPADGDVVLKRDAAVVGVHVKREPFAIEQAERLFKRKGGGGGGKGGGSSSSGSSSGSSSSSGKGGTGTGSTSGSTTGGRGSTSSSSNAGGATRAGSGVQPSFGGGKYYGGGASKPYTAGSKSPTGLIAPVFLGAGLLAVYPGLWLYGAYSYPYHNPYSYRNRSRNSTNTNDKRDSMFAQLGGLMKRQSDGVNETKPVDCLCAAYAVCGCDDTGDLTFLADLIGDGSYAGLNKSVIDVADINGTSTIILNGTLPNGTTIPKEGFIHGRGIGVIRYGILFLRGKL